MGIKHYNPYPNPIVHAFCWYYQAMKSLYHESLIFNKTRFYQVEKNDEIKSE